jgi:anaerobic magnesium-protoporphyrin IX monomethyl ester cyclase
MADITLVNMNMLYIKFLDGMVRRQLHLPLGPLYLVSALRGAGLDVDFRDYQLAEDENLFSVEYLRDFLRSPAPVIGISCMANLLPFVLYAVPAIKEAFPESTLVIGGVGPMSIEREILERVPGVDIVHRGEGEQSVPVLVRTLLEKGNLAGVPGIFYRSGGVIRHNEPLPRIQDLASLPRPWYRDIDFKRYIGHNILGSRGCPYPCTFCSIAPVWDWKPVSRSNEDIVAEMREMHDRHGVREFLFQDEYFVSSPQRIKEFAKLLAESKMDIRYKAFARADLVDEEAVRAMADTGCTELRFGVESGSDRVLRRIRKGFDAETALKAVTMAKRHIRGVDAFYVWGFPFETMEDFSESVFQMVTLRGMGVRILPSLLTYLPQTQVFLDLEDRSALEFCPWLLPEYMIGGMERRVSVRVSIDEAFRGFFDFIMRNKDIFPGFFHLDVETNIVPKLEMLEELDFYRKMADDSCGAHSPSQTGFEPEFADIAPKGITPDIA